MNNMMKQVKKMQQDMEKAQQELEEKEFTSSAGGKDSGAVGKRSKEKNIVLDVALKVGERINVLNPNIVVYYTRKDDRFIGLQQRADFANKKKADLFVSVHANSHKTSRPHGSETYVLGLHRTQDNLDVAMKSRW